MHFQMIPIAEYPPFPLSPLFDYKILILHKIIYMLELPALVMLFAARCYA